MLKQLKVVDIVAINTKTFSTYLTIFLAWLLKLLVLETAYNLLGKKPKPKPTQELLRQTGLQTANNPDSTH